MPHSAPAKPARLLTFPTPPPPPTTHAHPYLLCVRMCVCPLASSTVRIVCIFAQNCALCIFKFHSTLRFFIKTFRCPLTHSPPHEAALCHAHSTKRAAGSPCPPIPRPSPTRNVRTQLVNNLQLALNEFNCIRR